MMPSEHPVRKAVRGSLRHALGPSQTETFEDGLLLIDEKGKIVACGDYSKLRKRFPENVRVEDFSGHWIVPGFVDCHLHLPQLDCRNKNGLTLLNWLKKYIYPAEAQFADPKVVQETAPRFFDELMRHGITTAAIYSTVHYEATDTAFKIAKDKGLRVIMGQVLMDQNAPAALLRPAQRLLKETDTLIQKWHGVGNRLFYAVTPRFALTCSKNILKEAGKMAEHAKCYFQTHMAETKEEVQQAQTLYGFKNYPGFYGDCYCLGKHSLFAHAIYLEDEEWRILKETRSAIAHCPTSNVFLKSGTMPLSKAESFQIRIGFGTDIGAGPTFSMKEVSDCALKVHPQGVLTPEKAFYLATLGGAEALSLDKKIGNFAQGKSADFAVFGNKGLQGDVSCTYLGGEMIWKAS